jgi:hypothetical protein
VLVKPASIFGLVVFDLAGKAAMFVAVCARVQRRLADAFPGVHTPTPSLPGLATLAPE